jgi:hypothetical protein
MMTAVGGELANAVGLTLEFDRIEGSQGWSHGQLLTEGIWRV